MTIVNAEGWDPDRDSVGLGISKILKHDQVPNLKLVTFLDRKGHCLETNDENIVLSNKFDGFVLEGHSFTIETNAVELFKIRLNDLRSLFSLQLREVSALEYGPAQAQLKVVPKDLAFHAQGLSFGVIFNQRRR